MGIDTRSGSWGAVEKFAETRLAELREELESPGADERRSDEIRGAIDELKELLKLPVRLSPKKKRPQAAS